MLSREAEICVSDMSRYDTPRSTSSVKVEKAAEETLPQKHEQVL